MSKKQELRSIRHNMRDLIVEISGKAMTTIEYIRMRRIMYSYHIALRSGNETAQSNEINALKQKIVDQKNIIKDLKKQLENKDDCHSLADIEDLIANDASIKALNDMLNTMKY